MFWITLHSIFNLLHAHFPRVFVVDIGYFVAVAQIALWGIILCLGLLSNLFWFLAFFPVGGKNDHQQQVTLLHRRHGALFLFVKTTLVHKGGCTALLTVPWSQSIWSNLSVVSLPPEGPFLMLLTALKRLFLKLEIRLQGLSISTVILLPCPAQGCELSAAVFPSCHTLQSRALPKGWGARCEACLCPWAAAQ